MYKQTIAIVEDEVLIAEIVRNYLKKEGYEVVIFNSAEEAWEKLRYIQPSLLLCDVNLPGETGFQFAEQYRKLYPDSIIIFLTGNCTIEEKLTGFRAGADDYITKPFIVEELLARVKAHLRKSKLLTEEQLIIGDLKIDIQNKLVYRKDEPVELFVKEKKLLFFLASNYGRVYSPDSLLENVWGFDSESDLKTIIVHISNLRKKLEDNPKNPKYIKTIRGFGYKLYYEEAESSSTF